MRSIYLTIEGLGESGKPIAFAYGDDSAIDTNLYSVKRLTSVPNMIDHSVDIVSGSSTTSTLTFGIPHPTNLSYLFLSPENKVFARLTADISTLANGYIGVTRAGSFTAGEHIYIGSECLYVQFVDAGNHRLFVGRARFGTVAETHDKNAFIYTRPPYWISRRIIMNEVGTNYNKTIYKGFLSNITMSANNIAISCTSSLGHILDIEWPKGVKGVVTDVVEVSNDISRRMIHVDVPESLVYWSDIHNAHFQIGQSIYKVQGIKSYQDGQVSCVLSAPSSPAHLNPGPDYTGYGTVAQGDEVIEVIPFRTFNPVELFCTLTGATSYMPIDPYPLPSIYKMPVRMPVNVFDTVGIQDVVNSCASVGYLFVMGWDHEESSFDTLCTKLLFASGYSLVESEFGNIAIRRMPNLVMFDQLNINAATMMEILPDPAYFAQSSTRGKPPRSFVCRLGIGDDEHEEIVNLSGSYGNPSTYQLDLSIFRMAHGQVVAHVLQNNVPLSFSAPVLSVASNGDHHVFDTVYLRQDRIHDPIITGPYPELLRPNLQNRHMMFGIVISKQYDIHDCRYHYDVMMVTLDQMYGKRRAQACRIRGVQAQGGDYYDVVVDMGDINKWEALYDWGNTLWIRLMDPNGVEVVQGVVTGVDPMSGIIGIEVTTAPQADQIIALMPSRPSDPDFQVDGFFGWFDRENPLIDQLDYFV